MRSRLGILGGFVAVVAIGVLAFALFITLRQTPKAWTAGVSPAAAVVTLKSGQTVCQTPLDVPRGGSFDRVRMRLGTFRVAGPGLDVFVKDKNNGVLAHGVLSGGYPDVSDDVVRLDHRVPAGTRAISVCVKNGGPGKIAFYGNGSPANGQSAAVVDGKDSGFDLDLIFERQPHSYASELSTILSRATLFRSPRFNDTIYFLALLLLLGIATAGITYTLRNIDSDS